MPIHDYRCRSCGAEFEALVRASSPPPACPSCGADQLERLVSLPAAPGKSKAIVAAARRLEERRNGSAMGSRSRNQECD